MRLNVSLEQKNLPLREVLIEINNGNLQFHHNRM